MPQLLIVDDDEALRRWQERVMRENGYSCDGACDANDARAHLRSDSYRVALLDVKMPGESGIELLSQIRQEHPELAVVMVTGEDSAELAMTAMELGAYGYLVKPVGSGELLINVANALHRRSCEAQNREVLKRLQTAVAQREDRLAQMQQDLEFAEYKVWASQAETVARLARLMEFHNDETGHHLYRMSSYCQLLAQYIGLPDDHCELMRLASQLHDIGKVTVPDSILLKPGKLTPKEFEIIKGHAATGHEMLAGSTSEVVQLGALIAHTHHERWDGSGYPRGLAGGDIPIEGRIAAVADVFDALTSDRAYRPALPIKSATKMMNAQRGRHFDPALVDAFFASLPAIVAISQAEAER
jgi:putative two-component system response regulator